MTATTTAARVLAWACDPRDHPGTPPHGPAAEVSKLIAPEQATLERIGQLAAQTAARLGAGSPPFGDAGPVGLGVLLIAAAIGCRRDPGAASRLAHGAPPLSLTGAAGPAGDDQRAARPGWADAIARHGVVARFTGAGKPGTAHADGDLTESLIGASPLSAILIRPPLADLRDKRLDAYLDTAVSLLARPRGEPVLTCALARPATDARVLGWRASLLTRLLREHPEIALAAYRVALIRHGDDWDTLIDRAARAPIGSEAVLRFWAPLAAMDRDDPALLRTQPLFDGRYRRAIDLAGRFTTTTMSLVDQT